MSFKEILLKKRQGGQNSPAEIEALVQGLMEGKCSREQMAAWLMAVRFQGLTASETAVLTHAMWKSGKSFPRPAEEVFQVDKHSTGGVGDKTSLLLVPIVMAAAKELWGEGKVRIPMISGRGLGYTGGTLDKLESVSGFRADLCVDEGLRLLDRQGFFMMGQTLEVAPADRIIYSLRDLTATVDSEPLIVASIMSKKLCESLDGLVLDVKYGTGAMMKDIDRARELARAMTSVSKATGIEAVALLTPMDEPLGWTVGNAMEVEECAEFFDPLTREPGLEALVFELAAAMVQLASRGALSVESARKTCQRVAENGAAHTLFVQMFEAQGGDYFAFERSRIEVKEEMSQWVFNAPHSGYLRKMDAESFGKCLQLLGGGSPEKGNSFDSEVGLEVKKKVGDFTEKGEPVVSVRCRHFSQVSLMEPILRSAVEIGDLPMDKRTVSFGYVR